jgi:hypothetical protein
MYEGSESFSLRATSRTNSSVTNLASTSIVDSGDGLKYTGTFSSGLPVTDGTDLDNDLSVSVTSYSPVNEGSTWAMFKVVAAAGDVLDLAVTDTSTTNLAGAVVAYSYNGTSWTVYSSSAKPTVPGTVGNGTFYVRVNITPEQETDLDTGEIFALRATSNGSGSKTGSANATIVDDGSGTLFTGDFGNDLPGVSSNYRDDDRLIAVRDKVFSRTPSGVVLTDVRSNDTTRNGATISTSIGLNPQSAAVSSTFTNAQGTWTVLTGGEVRFTPVSTLRTDPAPISYAISSEGGANYSLNTAQLFVDYGVGVVADSVNGVAPATPVVNVDVLSNDTAGDTYDSDTLKLIDVANGNNLVDSLSVAGQGTWRVVSSGTLGRKILQFEANLSGGTKSFAGDPSPVSYAVRDRVTDGGYRGGNLSSFGTATISYVVANSNPFFIRINDRSNDAGSTAWDAIVVDNVAAGVTVALYENGMFIQNLVTTSADQSNTVGLISYQGSTTGYSTVKVNAKSKPVTTGSVADISLSTTTQSRRGATIEIQAVDSRFIAASTSSTNKLVSPMSGTQTTGSTTAFRESLGLLNQAFPQTAGGTVIENNQTTTARSVAISASSANFTLTAGQQTSLMKSLVTTNTAASQVVSLNAGGKVIQDSADGRELAAINQWFFAIGLSNLAADPSQLAELRRAWTSADVLASREQFQFAQRKSVENKSIEVTTVSSGEAGGDLTDERFVDSLATSSSLETSSLDDPRRAKRSLGSELRGKRTGRFQI